MKAAKCLNKVGKQKAKEKKKRQLEKQAAANGVNRQQVSKKKKKKKYLREAEFLRNKNGQGFSSLQRTVHRFVELFQNNVRRCKIGKILNIQPSTIQNIIKGFREFGDISAYKGQCQKSIMDFWVFRQDYIKMGMILS